MYIPNEYTWQTCRMAAQEHWRAMEFEKYTECCLSFLSNHLLSPTKVINANVSLSKSLRVILPCGGTGSRWKRFLNIPKQQINMGDGLPLVQRTINQFRSYMPEVPFHILISKDANEDFNNINSANFLDTLLGEEEQVVVEVLENILVNPLMQSDVLLIYGDVYFSESAVETIVKTVCGECNYPKYFGRKHQNKNFGNNGGEIFGIYIPFRHQELLLMYYKFINSMYFGFPLHSISSWEVLALLGLLNKSNTGELVHPCLIENNAVSTYNQLVEVFRKREFNPMTWIEIDDETEDFDFPYEYLQRLGWTVKWVGEQMITTF